MNTADHIRLILYFPVSALVTLFGNILQNPGDPRARSDVRLMNLVVSFLSMLAAEEENGGVKRMLGVCSEFERIARIVLDKSDKDSSSRRKRKTNEEPPIKISMTRPSIPTTPAQSNVKTPHMGYSNNGTKWCARPSHRPYGLQSHEWQLAPWKCLDAGRFI